MLHLKPLHIVFLSLILFAGIFFIFKQDVPIKNYPLREGPIVAFGDSLVFGFGSTQGGGFVSLLSQKLGEPIINHGVSGNTSADALSRINDVISEKPRLVLVLLGGNDFLRKVPHDTTFNNLRLIIQTIQSNGSAVVLMGVRGGLLNDPVDSLYEDLAYDTGSFYIPDVLDGLFADSRFMSDSIHPNDRGYARIADKVYDTLNSFIR